MGRAQGKAATTIQNDVAKNSMSMSAANNAQSAPWLKQSGDYYSALVAGDPSKLSTYVGPQVQAARGAYDAARAQINRTAPKGGMRDSMLGNLENQQAGDVSRIFTGGVNDALQRLASLGSGGQQLSLAGLGQAGNAGESLAKLSASKAQAVGQGIAGIGGAAGGMLGGMASNPNFIKPK